jgi:hypothetical protein
MCPQREGNNKGIFIADPSGLPRQAFFLRVRDGPT